MTYYLWVMIIAAGVYLEFGAGWAMITGGAIGAASALLLMNVDDKAEESK